VISEAPDVDQVEFAAKVFAGGRQASKPTLVDFARGNERNAL
jgi:hypothetical protein